MISPVGIAQPPRPDLRPRSAWLLRLFIPSHFRRTRPRAHGILAFMPLKENQFGRYYEDFEEGDVYRSPLGRTITEADNIWMTLLTMNTNQSHFNDHYAASTPYGKAIVNSGVTLAIVLGLSVVDTSQKVFANLGWDRIRLTKPVFVGDTLYAESQVLSKRESESRPYGGIVSFRTRGLNQDGGTVLVYERSVFAYKRSAPQDKGFWPEPDVPIEELG